MEARLQLRQTQRLVMTPMLQQAIQLLQLSTIELQELLQKELTENPMLEEAPPEETAPAEVVAESTTPEAPAPEPVPERPEAETPDLPFDITEVMFGPPDERTLVQQEEHDETRFENFVGAAVSLTDHLSEQLRLSHAPPEVRTLAEYVIGNMDEDGFVPATLLFERALELVQRVRPAGIGARTLKECLALQLRREEPLDRLASRIVEEQFPACLELDALPAAGAPSRQEIEARIAWKTVDREGLITLLRRRRGERPALATLDEARLESLVKQVEAPDGRRATREATPGERRSELARALGLGESEAEAALEAARGVWEEHVAQVVERLLALERRPGRQIEGAESLAALVRGQLAGAVGLPDVPVAVDAVLDHLDRDGYLQASLEDLVTKTTLPVFERTLAIIQGFDPAGVGARSIRECLLVQLRGQESPDPLAIEIVDEHFDAFRRCRYQDIARVLKRDPDRVMEAVDEVARLEPKPGRRFATADTRYIVPDVYVHKVDDDYAIVLNDEGIPRLRINSYYRSVIGRAQGDEARRYVEDRLRSAVWLIKSVHQRQKTLYKVTRSIVQFQRAFLDRGLPHLRPLSLRHVAEDIQMHESTVSRVTTNKYVQTPQGLFELKYFFHSGIAKEHGDDVSSVSVKKMIQDLIEAEDPGKPLSDQDITQRLKDRGLTIARRTVAKYREELGILPSHQRRLAPRKRG